jgi:drug/metabolite transporter (DMT)-like permease
MFNGKYKEIKKFSKKDIVYFIILGFIGIFLHNVLYNYGFSLIPAVEASVLNYLWPFFIVVFSIILLKDKLSHKKMVAITAGFIGTYIVFTKGSIIPVFTNLRGDVIMVLGACMWALFSVFGSREKYEDYSSMFLKIFFGFIFIALLMVLTTSFRLLTMKEVLLLIYLGLVTKGIAYPFWIMSMRKIGRAKTANLAYLSPFVALIMINLFLGEVIHWFYIVALILIIGGILLQEKNEVKRYRRIWFNKKNL